jgi:hypothetical protein
MKEFFKTLVGLEMELPYSGRVTSLRADFVWQFLRFNPKYIEGYDRLTNSGDDSGELAMAFAEAWGISAPVDHKLERLPFEQDDDGFDLTPSFEFKPVRAIRNRKYIEDWAEVLFPEQHQLLVVHPYARPNQVAQFLSELEMKKKAPETEVTMRSLRRSQLVQYIVCHHYLKLEGMGPTEFSPIYHEIFQPLRTDTLQTTFLNGKIEGFNAIVKVSPWCFFTPPHR